MMRRIIWLEIIISILGWLCALAAFMVPLWFVVAVLGTKWAFWEWQFGLDVLIRVWGLWLLYGVIGISVFTGLLIGLHRGLVKTWFGVVSAPILALTIGMSGTAWIFISETLVADRVSVVDVTTDFVDPPHFSSGFMARREAAAQSLDYASKTGEGGRALPDIQQEGYPAIQTLMVNAEPDDVYRAAITLARDSGWHIGTASESAGMFEAGAESFWFGFKDDMVVRVRAQEDGPTLVDVRSLAREVRPDHGRNARRVEGYLTELSEIYATVSTSR